MIHEKCDAISVDKIFRISFSALCSTMKGQFEDLLRVLVLFAYYTNPATDHACPMTSTLNKPARARGKVLLS